MCFLIVMTTVTAGLGSAVLANRFPQHAAVFETGAGILLIAGLALLGMQFSPLLAHP